MPIAGEAGQGEAKDGRIFDGRGGRRQGTGTKDVIAGAGKGKEQGSSNRGNSK